MLRWTVSVFIRVHVRLLIRIAEARSKAVQQLASEWSCLAVFQLMAAHGWGIPAGRVNTPESPVLPLQGAGRGGVRWPESCVDVSRPELNRRAPHDWLCQEREKLWVCTLT